MENVKQRGNAIVQTVEDSHVEKLAHYGPINRFGEHETPEWEPKELTEEAYPDWNNQSLKDT